MKFSQNYNSAPHIFNQVPPNQLSTYYKLAPNQTFRNFRLAPKSKSAFAYLQKRPQLLIKNALGHNFLVFDPNRVKRTPNDSKFEPQSRHIILVRKICLKFQFYPSSMKIPKSSPNIFNYPVSLLISSIYIRLPPNLRDYLTICYIYA